jgi:hypothetical protein
LATTFAGSCIVGSGANEECIEWYADAEHAGSLPTGTNCPAPNTPSTAPCPKLSAECSYPQPTDIQGACVRSDDYYGSYYLGAGILDPIKQGCTNAGGTWTQF